MATYTNQIPAILASGDILQFTTSGTWTLPKRSVFSLDIRGARGGNGGHLISSIDGSISWRGGPGGYGGRIDCEKVSLEGVISIAIGGVGANGANRTIPWPHVSGDSYQSAPGQDGGKTTLSMNGVLLASALGGGGGGRATFNPNSNGAPGANQGADVVPVGGVATTGGGNAGAGTVTLTVINQPPTTPTGLNYAAPNAGKQVTITWAGSTDPDEGDTIQYAVERRVDNGVYKQIAVTSGTFCTDICPMEGAYYQVRVKAVDSAGNESGWLTGPSLPINYNNPPEITGEDTDWGAIAQPQTYNYTPSDPDAGQTLTVTERVTNGAQVAILRTFTAISGQSYTADVSDVWMRLAKGSHALMITVADNLGGEVTRTITFSRAVTRIAAARAFSTDNPISSVLITLFPTPPASAALHVEACNNPFDPTPAWENITGNIGNYVYKFSNQEAVNGPGLGYRFSITPNGTPVYFDLIAIRFFGEEA